jgi:hypothetical protein
MARPDFRGFDRGPRDGMSDRFEGWHRDHDGHRGHDAWRRDSDRPHEAFRGPRPGDRDRDRSDSDDRRDEKWRGPRDREPRGPQMRSERGEDRHGLSGIPQDEIEFATLLVELI